MDVGGVLCELDAGVGDGCAAGVDDAPCDRGCDLRVASCGEKEGQDGEELADELCRDGLQKGYEGLPGSTAVYAQEFRGPN